jgi:ubiquitin-conjugating enzyme E2 J2
MTQHKQVLPILKGVLVLKFRAGMALSTTRLRREFKELQKNPLQNIRAAPKETNILEWHYVIIGQEKTDYADGYYHGTVVFPSEYPYKPPTIRMMTPSGRFKVPF